MACNRSEAQEQAELYGSAPESVSLVLKSTFTRGGEVTADVRLRVRKYVDANLLDVKVKGLKHK